MSHCLTRKQSALVTSGFSTNPARTTCIRADASSRQNSRSRPGARSCKPLRCGDSMLDCGLLPNLLAKGGGEGIAGDGEPQVFSNLLIFICINLGSNPTLSTN